MNGSELALFGGSKTISADLAAEISNAKRWPRVSEETIRKCSDLMRRGLLSLAFGGIIEELENKFKNYTGSKFCLIQNNGTSTIHSAYFAVGVKPGDEVIVPSHTWTASVSPILPLGGVPVFCDIDPATLLMDPDDIERKITSKTKAICIVHLWGNVCDMDRIMDISRRYGIPVVEDCSHAHGATYKGRRVGTFGAAGCFSMQGTKVLPGGELGAVVTNDDKIFDQMVILGHQGRVRNTVISDEFKDYEAGLGFKYRPFPIPVQIALDQMDRIEEYNLQRRLTVDYFNKELEGIEGVTTVKQLEGTRRGCYHYIFLFESKKKDIGSQRFIEALRAEGLEVNPMRYKMVHTLLPFSRLKADVPITEKLVPCMYIIMPFTISDEEKIAYYTRKYSEGIRKVVDSIHKLI